MTGKEIRYLSVAVPIAPTDIYASDDEELNRVVIKNIAAQLAARPPRLPKGLNYSALSNEVAALLGSAPLGYVRCLAT